MSQINPTSKLASSWLLALWIYLNHIYTGTESPWNLTRLQYFNVLHYKHWLGICTETQCACLCGFSTRLGHWSRVSCYLDSEIGGWIERENGADSIYLDEWTMLVDVQFRYLPMSFVATTPNKHSVVHCMYDVNDLSASFNSLMHSGSFYDVKRTRCAPYLAVGTR